ncbi:MAG: hypothetical protein AAFZ07_07855 [Actinomycetota bacterium]
MVRREIECQCGERHPEGTEFCTCGKYLPHAGTLVEVASPPPAPSVPEPPAAEPTAPAPAEEPTAPAPVEPAAVEPTAVEPAALPDPPSAPAAMVHDPATFQAIEPEALRDRPDVEEIPGRTGRPDDVICRVPTCRTANDSDRHFCAVCGAELAGPGWEQADPEVRRSWWQRLRDRVTGRDPRASAASAKHSVRRVRGLSTRARMFRTAIFGGAAGVFVIALVPGLRSQALDATKDVVLIDRYRYVDVAGVTSVSGPPVIGWEPELLADGTTNRAWAGRWTTQGEGFVIPGEQQPCLVIDFPGVDVTFDEPTDLDRARIWAGAWEDDEARANRPQPRVLQLRYTSETGPVEECEFVTLESEPEAQTVSLSADDVVSVEIRVVGVELGAPEETLVALSEVWFERSR